jgi:DNA primase
MAGISDDYKAQIKAATDIVQLIGRTVALKRRGRDYVGLCPFHQEKSPSFTVNPAQQYFYCYGCKAGGDIFSFVEKRDRIEFVDALRLLGEQAGIEPPQRSGSREKPGEKQLLLDMQSAACAFFEKLLSHPQQGAEARAYLEERRISSESIKRFQIGLAPDAWDGLINSPAGRKFTPQQLEMAGLAKPRQNGQGHYDTFRNRLMFPIRDQEARIIAFGGRKMPGSEDPAKYLNSPETQLFQKSRCIFGIDLARQRMVESRTAIVVEGYADVVVPHQFGISNVVSPLGTALTEQHVTLLRRFVDRIVLLFDADSAGNAAVDRSVGLFLTQPVEIAIASIPSGQDPDEFILEHGPEAFQALVDGAVDALAYKWKQLVTEFDASAENLTGQQRAIEAYLNLLASARGSGPVDALRWGSALARVNRLTDIPVEELTRRFGRVKVSRPAVTPSHSPGQKSPDVAAAPPPPARPLTGQAMAERWILGVLLLEPNRWHDVQQAVHLEDFHDEACRRLAETYWNHQRDEGEPVFNEFIGTLRDPNLLEIAITAADEVEALGDKNVVLSDVYAFFDRNRRVRDEQKLVASSRRISHDDQEAEGNKLLRELSQLRSQADLRRPAR